MSEEEKAAGLAQMGEHVNAIPAIKARVVGPDFGGEFDYGAVTVLEDIEGYEQYMNHPAHLAMDRMWRSWLLGLGSTPAVRRLGVADSSFSRLTAWTSSHLVD
ncbi:Dabb family protein [Amycolatopsis sp. WAC 04197]|uniref:Dabb family protein n=1 Tax=Amycolatopsis sp. WAC 04197 TaxID=2203199 RepID=UPI001F31362A|nr:Dabb family protein [Amycolatopsis sp. WAC 04197]